MKIEDLPENTHLPQMVASGFVQLTASFGYELDYSLNSLFNGLEKIFEDQRLAGKTFTIKAEQEAQTHNFENGLASYLGETFVQLYHGQWSGFFSEKTGMNYYTSSIQFGDFNFQPFAYVTYRMSNGAQDTGDLKKLFSRIEKSMQDGINYKKQEIQALIDAGKIAVDNEPWS